MSPTPKDRFWYQLRFRIPREWEELLSGWLIDLTGRGVACYPHGAQAEVFGYCPTPEAQQAVWEEIASRWGRFCAETGEISPLAFDPQIVREEDWANSWKAYFHPLRLGRIVIKPTWESWPPPDNPGAAHADDLLIEIDPQMAFGTGSHATTQLCLGALERHLRPSDRVADIGCGSGVLSIAAARLGSGPVEAWEVDPVAVEVATENFALNGVSGVCSVREGDALEGLAGQFDLIVANVHTQFLLRLIPRLPGHLLPAGRAVLSGTTDTSAGAILAALKAVGLQPLEQNGRGEWIEITAASA
jgi:ribosomal protein L11 methyltransferase